jgi:hypothetical protein
MPINPNIALGVQQQQPVNMLGQMGQMLALKGAVQEMQGNEDLRAAYSQGGDLNDPEFRRKVMAANPKLGSQLIKTNAETGKLQNEAIANRIKLSREMLTGVNTPEDYIAWHESNHKDPVLGSYLTQRGVTAEQSRAKIIADLAKPGGLDKLKRESALGATDLQKELMQTERTRISAAPAFQRNAMLQKQWQHSIDNPKMTPLAGEKIDAKGNKVPAYFGYDPTTNTMEEVRMPTVTVGPLTTIDPNAPTNNLAPASVNALTAPPTAGAPTSPVMRPPALTAPSAAAPTAAMPSATSPTSVSGGVRFGPKSTSDSLTEAQGKATNFSIRAKQAHEVLNTIGEDGKVQPGLIKRGAEAIPFIGEGLGTALNITQSDAQQQVEQAQRNFVNALLRQESGAAINKDEFENAKKQYFPQPGDSAAVIEQKRLNREAVIKGFDIAAGPGAKQATPPSTEPKRINSMDEYNSLPSGATYIDPEGTTRRKK